MARRPRPASRRPPQRVLGQQPTIQGKVTPARPAKRKPQPEPVESDEEDDSENYEAKVSGSEEAEDDSGEDVDEDEEEEEEDVDAPRVSQWVDEEELELEAEDEQGSDASEDEDDDEDEESVAGPSNLRALQDDLSALPLGALRKAQRALAQARADSDASDDDGASSRGDSDDDSAPEEAPSRMSAKGKARERETERAKPDIEKRKNKHAPIEMSSKRRERRKVVIEDKKPTPRDPRFLPMTGEFSADRFRTQYGFLSGMHQDEMKTLKDNLKRARRMLAASPRDQRAAREAEVERLERAVKRAESTVNKDRRDQIEETVMRRARLAERERQRQGKGAWHMKSADKKEMLTRARYDALAEAGGKRAVKKAIEKKQKKVSQKEKKRRPFAPGETAKRLFGGQADAARPSKRQRFG